MDIWEKSKLIIFILFIVPGFVSMKMYGVMQPGAHKDSSKAILDVVTYSCINYAIWLPAIFYIERYDIYHSSPLMYYFFYLCILLVSPSILPGLLLALRKQDFVKKRLPHPVGKPWDYFFSLGVPCWVIVTLKDGQKIGGRYDSGSFASSSPENEQIYLQEHWKLNDDGGLERARTDTLGIIILSSEIVTVELFKMTPKS